MYNEMKMKLEQASMQRGSLPYRDRVVVDADCTGLRFVVSPDGSGASWVRRFKDKTGKMKQYTFSQYPDVSLTEAREYVNQVRGMGSETKCTYGVPTVGALIDKYLTEYIKAQRTQAAYAGVKSALINNYKSIAGKRLDEINAAMLHELILITKERAPTMARLMRSELKQAWSYALAIGMTDVPCPITSLTGGRFKPSVRDRILTDDEIVLLLKHLDQYSPDLADVIIICLYTGLRSGEVIAIHTSWFETDDDGVLWLTIPRERMKNTMAHRVPILSKAREVMDTRMQQHAAGYLFPMKRNHAKHITQAALSREVYNTQCDVDGWHLHDLRRTTRTNLQRIGAPFEISESILAHKLPGISSVYARFQYNDEKIKWLQLLADYYNNRG